MRITLRNLDVKDSGQDAGEVAEEGGVGHHNLESWSMTEEMATEEKWKEKMKDATRKGWKEKDKPWARRWLRRREGKRVGRWREAAGWRRKPNININKQ